MAVIDASYFFGEINIAQKTDVASSLLMFIEEHEETLLTDLFGYELYKDYKSGITAGTPEAKWVAIRDGLEYTNRSGVLTKWKGLKFTDGSTAKKSLIANYVYWHWMQNEITVTTGSGEKKPANQNAGDATAVYKMTRAWNQMVKWNNELIEFLLTKATDYPQFQNHYGRIPRNILRTQNVFGI